MFNSFDIPTLVLSALAVLITLTVHEYAHGYAAYKLGDGTARAFGRLSLNPIKHLDPVGALCLLFFHFGWAKPVPINPRNFKNPKRDFALSALAGPLVNIILAFITAFFYILALKQLSPIALGEGFVARLAYNLILFIGLFHSINLGLGIFNLIPIPPLDGSRILTAVLPPRLYFGIMKYERKIYFALLIWMLLGGSVKRFLLSFSFIAANPVLSAIAGIFSLSGMLSSLISAISGLMLDFWGLLPFLKL